jgi:hypothetical protein
MLDMNDAEPSPVEDSGTPHLNEAMLRSEVLFWQELIESGGDALPPESVERMEQALELARSRLSALFDEYRRSGNAGGSDQSNVFYLHRPAAAGE